MDFTQPLDTLKGLGQDLVGILGSSPEALLGIVVTLILFLFGDHKLKDNARAAIEQAEADLSRTGEEKLEEAVTALINMLPEKIRFFVSPMKGLIVMLVQRLFDKEYGHFKKGTSPAEPEVDVVDGVPHPALEQIDEILNPSPEKLEASIDESLNKLFNKE